jgi:hypothetical protein
MTGAFAVRSFMSRHTRAISELDRALRRVEQDVSAVEGSNDT